MNVIEFKVPDEKNLVFCMVDTFNTFKENWIKELIKNQSDYTISNLYSKKYTILQGLDEDDLIKYASKKYDYACVFSTGTEFINGDSFFKNIELECTDDFLIKGHILDRGDAYYELHHQCYLINLKNYRFLNFPLIGKQELATSHVQLDPIRSEENIHDAYTPFWIKQGSLYRNYNHKCHGWNIISKSLEYFNIIAFNTEIRNNKKHLYPENTKDFYKQINYVYFKERYCNDTFVHTKNTEHINFCLENIKQIITPASGEWYINNINKETDLKVIIYDYNLNSLKYWKDNVSKLPNIDYQYIHCDLLNDPSNLFLEINKELENFTLINLSNIFCYEGTAVLSNTKYRIYKENQILNYLKEHFPNAYVFISVRASSGFIHHEELPIKIKDIPQYDIKDLKKPTWHQNEDWLSF
jgi:hypothetical protein